MLPWAVFPLGFQPVFAHNHDCCTILCAILLLSFQPVFAIAMVAPQSSELYFCWVFTPPFLVTLVAAKCSALYFFWAFARHCSPMDGFKKIEEHYYYRGKNIFVSFALFVVKQLFFNECVMFIATDCHEITRYVRAVPCLSVAITTPRTSDNISASHGFTLLQNMSIKLFHSQNACVHSHA